MILTLIKIMPNLFLSAMKPSVMADGFMHKDQIWFADKRKSHAT